MKVANLMVSRASLVLLVVQLALVISPVAARYAWQRWNSPRVWVRAHRSDTNDPRATPHRGTHISLRLEVDGCKSTLPSAKEAEFQRDFNGAVKPGPFTIRTLQPVQFFATLKVKNNRLEAIRIEDAEYGRNGQWIDAWPGNSCSQMTLLANYEVKEDAPDALLDGPNNELWAKVIVPPTGPVEIVKLARKTNGAWKTLSY